jgi:hypothetical protein
VSFAAFWTSSFFLMILLHILSLFIELKLCSLSVNRCAKLLQSTDTSA